MFFQCSPDPFDFPPVIASSSFNSDFFPLPPSPPRIPITGSVNILFAFSSLPLPLSFDRPLPRFATRRVRVSNFFLKRGGWKGGGIIPRLSFDEFGREGGKGGGGEANRTFLLPFRLNIQAIQSISLGRDARWRAKTAARSEDGFGLPAIPYLYLPSNILRRRLGNGEGGRRERERERVQSRFYWFSRETGLSTFLCPAEIHREEVPFENSNLPSPPPSPHFPLSSSSSPPSIPLFTRAKLVIPSLVLIILRIPR